MAAILKWFNFELNDLTLGSLAVVVAFASTIYCMKFLFAKKPVEPIKTQQQRKKTAANLVAPTASATATKKKPQKTTEIKPRALKSTQAQPSPQQQQEAAVKEEKVLVEKEKKKKKQPQPQQQDVKNNSKKANKTLLAKQKDVVANAKNAASVKAAKGKVANNNAGNVNSVSAILDGGEWQTVLPKKQQKEKKLTADPLIQAVANAVDKQKKTQLSSPPPPANKPSLATANSSKVSQVIEAAEQDLDPETWMSRSESPKAK